MFLKRMTYLETMTYALLKTNISLGVQQLIVAVNKLDNVGYRYAVCCSVLQCVAACCSVLQCVAAATV